MRIIAIHDGELRPEERPTPTPGPGQVLIEIAAAGVNRADLLQVAGQYPPPPGEPEHPGLEVAGTVLATGPGVTNRAVGDRVAALLAGGGYASHVVVCAAQTFAVPDSVGLPEAAALPEALATVWSNLVEVAHLAAGETALILGASGGIGTAALQIARLRGAHVVATAGGPEKVAQVRRLAERLPGVTTPVLDHRALDGEELTAAVLDATGGHGVDVILDPLGGRAVGQNVRRLATGGRLVIIGTQAGRTGELDVLTLMQRRASVHGTTLRSRPAAEKARIVDGVVAHLLPQVAAGALRPVVHARIELERAAEAHRLLASGDVVGKVVLLV